MGVVHSEIIEPLVGSAHGAALIGEGSEVLGYDTARSTDHNWGPRVTVFICEEKVEALRARIMRHLPDYYWGFPVKPYQRSDGEEPGICVTTLQRWLQKKLHIENIHDIQDWQWLGFPQQHLLEFTAGPVFHDDTGKLTQAKRLLAYYPKDIWLWMMSSQWYQIGISEPLLHRALEVEDDIGARILLSKIIRYCMELYFLQSRRYWPYDKWFGTAFSSLPGSEQLRPFIEETLDTAGLSSLKELLLRLGKRHNELEITDYVEPGYADFHVGIDHAVRPYQVMNAGAYKDSCLDAVSSPSLKNMICVGAIDQINTNDAMINFTGWPQQISELYKANMTED